MRQRLVHTRSSVVSALGAFTFVLHSHLPYARLAGRWPHGEEWIHEAATETYLPLLQALYDLKEEGVRYKITIGITPILAEQLADADVLHNLDLYLDDKIERARKDLERFTAIPEVVDRYDEDEDDDLYGDEDEDLYEARKKPIPVNPPDWWVGNPQMIELAKYYQRYFEGTKRAL